jgi:hypothetical protein
MTCQEKLDGRRGRVVSQVGGAVLVDQATDHVGDVIGAGHGSVLLGRDDRERDVLAAL